MKNVLALIILTMATSAFAGEVEKIIALIEPTHSFYLLNGR